MTHSVIYLLLLCIVVLKLSTPKKNASSYSTMKRIIETEGFSSPTTRESRNLKLMLDFVNESPEFRPLTLSILLPEFQTGLMDFLMKYVAENSIEAYTKTSADEIPKDLVDRILTWTLVVKDIDSLNILVHWQQNLWQACNQYLIIFTTKGVTVPWRDVFKHLWGKHRVYKAVVLSVQDDFQCLLRYAPFHEGQKKDYGGVYRFCFKANVPRKVKSLQNFYSSDNLNKLEGVDEMFPLTKDTELFERFETLNNYPVNVVVFESLFMDISYDKQKRLTKADANVLFALEEAMKAKFHVKAMRKPDFRRYDPFDISLRHIETGSAEMVITGFFVKTYDKHREFQFTSAVYEDRVCFLSPDSGLVPKAYMPFLPFERNLWILLIIYNIVITALWCCMKYTSQTLRGSCQVSRFPQNSARKNKQTPCLPGQVKMNRQVKSRSNGSRVVHLRSSNPSSTSLNRQPRPPDIPQYLQQFFHFIEMLCYPIQSGNSPAQRALFIGTLFFGLIMNGLYQSYLVSSLSKPFHYPQLHTVEDVFESGKQLITKYANLKSVFLDDSPLDRKLSQRIHIINSSKRTKDIVAFENKIAVSRYYSMILATSVYYDKEGNSLLWVVDECPMMYRVSYVLRSQSPYMERVNFILLRLREAGLFGYWFQNMTYRLTIMKMRRKAEMEKRTIQLTLDHYSLTFLLLFVGLFVCALAFFGELYVAEKARRSGTEAEGRRIFPGYESSRRKRRAQRRIFCSPWNGTLDHRTEFHGASSTNGVDADFEDPSRYVGTLIFS